MTGTTGPGQGGCAGSAAACQAGTEQAGARILREPEYQFYGDRTYTAEDPEAHQWSFSQHVRDVTPGETRQRTGA